MEPYITWKMSPLDKKKTHDIEVVVDRVVMHPDLGDRLADALETTLKLSNGLAVIEKVTGGERTLFSRVLKSKKPFEGVILSLQCRWKEQEKAGKNSGKALLSK